jgi:ketopantoate reductase
MLNSSLDPVAAIIGGAIGDVFRRSASFRAFRVLLGEALAVARGAGWRLRAVQGVRPDVLSAVFATPMLRMVAARAAARQARAVASTLSREIRRGDLGEADHLCGAIVREGVRVGVATPGHIRALDILRRIAGEPGGNGGRPELARELVQR